MEHLLQALRDDIRKQRSILVIGAGVSASISGSAPTATWSGLLESGILAAMDHNPSCRDDWRASVEGDLRLGAGGSLASFMSAAEKIVEALDGITSPACRTWLRESIGNLAPVNRRLAEALHGLSIPITTTNYDTLVEAITSRESTTWRDVSRTQRSLRGMDSAVVHLHGVWREPESLILTSQSYGTMRAAEPAQALQQAMAALRSLIFVGFGAGLSDPNLGALMKWLGTLFEGTEIKHYRLCRASEVARLQEETKTAPIFPIVYGDHYEDLAPFIESLVDNRATELADDRRPTLADAIDLGNAALVERVREETILADHLRDLNARSLDQILIPPVLLPMSQEQFVRATSGASGERPARCDPASEAALHDTILLAAQERSGLTSAIEWLIAQRSAVCDDGEAVPVLVDFRKVGGSRTPLEREIRKALSTAGVLATPRDPLPRFILGLDNFFPNGQKSYERAIAELGALDSCCGVVIGCREGIESAVHLDVETLSQRSARVLYLGRLAGSDVGKLVALVDPGRVRKLSNRIVEVADREHLSRTPFTVGLLLCVLLSGEALLGTASETALLDAYVNLLLGRGDVHDDARFTLDSLERVHIVGALAAEFVERRTGSISEATAIVLLENYFESRDWTESPNAVLTNLINRHILAMSGGQVRFTQTSLLHLFAAKRMTADESFRQRILDSPVYFARIVKHYAALTRDDADALKRVYELLGRNPVDISSRSAAFAEHGEEDEQAGAHTIDSVLARIESMSPPDKPGAIESLEPDTDEDGLDFGAEDDLVPFPVDDIEAAPRAIQLFVVLDLVSTVLRDSEIVSDPELKRRVLRDALLMWGSVVSLFEEDELLMEFTRQLGTGLSAQLNVNEKRRSGFVERFARCAPILFAVSGLTTALSSRKLVRPLDRCLSEDEFFDRPAGAAFGTLMALMINEPGWGQYLNRLHEHHGRVVAVREVVRPFVQISYLGAGLAGRDVDYDDVVAMETFLARQYTDELAVENEPARLAKEAQIREKLRQQQLRSKHLRALEAKQGEGPGADEVAP